MRSQAYAQVNVTSDAESARQVQPRTRVAETYADRANHMSTVAKDSLVAVTQHQELDTSMNVPAAEPGRRTLVNGTVTTPATLKNPMVSSPLIPS